MQSFEQASAFVNAITGNQADSAIIDFRAIHDSNKAIPAIPFRDTIGNAWSSICHYNGQGYGIFATVAAMDGNGRELANVQGLRAHYVDLDNLSAAQNLDRAAAWQPAPSFAVNSSPNKFHVYWPTVPYAGNDRFGLIQRKLRQFFDGDKAVVDAARVMRLPGTFNYKYSDPTSDKHVAGSAPHLVNCFALPGYGSVTPPEWLEGALAGVNVVDGGGDRHKLGDPALAAPSLEWLSFGLKHLNPNDLSREEWISTTAAVKQAGWTVADEATLFNVWSEWCSRYTANDAGENLKQWNSIRETQVGWPAIKRRVPILAAYLAHGAQPPAYTLPTPQPALPGTPSGAPQPAPAPLPQPMPIPPGADTSGEILSAEEQKIWFKDCVYVESFGEILTPKGRFMGATKFNGAYGGKIFVVTSSGKVTNEPWAAATRSTIWTVPKVDHIRFLPDAARGEIVTDQLGRLGVNTYVPIPIDARQGDVTPFLRHMELLFPDPSDRETLFKFFAHTIKYVGTKIPWAPLIQGAEGIGKTFFQEMMQYCLGSMYCYTPKAEELVKSGSTFNGWMRSRLFISVHEIKVDERRELVEILKPMITDLRIEIQSKGVDQEMEDNPSKWMFFSNHKDAIPIGLNGRRYAIFYSAIQSVGDLLARGMDDAYFNGLFRWLREGGHAHISHWLLNYPIERHGTGQRAPITSSTAEALRISRGPIERVIVEAIEDGLPGFKGGFVSVTAVMRRLKAVGIRQPSPSTVETILAAMGYADAGRAPRPYIQEDAFARSHLFYILPGVNGAAYGRLQGYE